jgi:DNA-binding transcriptional ArsR family regulator
MANGVVTLPMDQLVRPAIALKEDDPSFYLRLKERLKKRGQTRTVLVCEKGDRYEVLEGTKIVRALKELGETEVLCYNLGELSEIDKDLVRLEVSKDYFLMNYVSVGKLLKKLMDAGMTEDEILHTVPYDRHKVQTLVDFLGFDWNSLKKGGGEGLFGLLDEESISS